MTTANHRIITLKLDDDSLPARSSEIEIERHRAISDLLDENSFRLAAPEAAEGPYRLLLTLMKDHLLIAATCAKSGHEEEITLPLSGLKRHIGDYVIVCDNFYKTARAGEFHRLEAIDAGRRSIHNEAAELLLETLENKVILDKSTARRLFTLLYVLHMRGTPTII
ncbi:MAG: UPF0262 family protein [Alphaproteobacteria bacterium]|nr:UPF0262 family protein [Alphaproteobacteria bacterium]